MRHPCLSLIDLCSFVCLFGFLTSSSTTRLYRGRAPRQERLTILRAATHETELGDHDFCLSRSHYTDTDPTCRERAATAEIEPGTSSPGVTRSTAELPRPPVCAQTRNQLGFLSGSNVGNAGHVPTDKCCSSLSSVLAIYLQNCLISPLPPEFSVFAYSQSQSEFKYEKSQWLVSLLKYRQPCGKQDPQLDNQANKF